MPDAAPESRRVMVITGSRKGIGRSLAEHYLERGWTVHGLSRGASDLVHDHYHHWQADVTEETAVREAFSAIRRGGHPLYALLNNAGVASMNHTLSTPYETVRRILEVNVAGTWLCSREAAKLMSRAGRGRIVNFGSVATPLRLEGEVPYAASKSAVVSMTRTLAREFSAFGVTVNAVGPTPLRTDLIRGVPPEKLDRLIARQGIPRWGTTDDVINVCDFFLSDRSDFVSGQCIYLGGVS